MAGKRRSWLVAVAIFLVLSATGGIYLWNYVSLQQKMDQVIQSDPRNTGVKVVVHYKRYVVGTTLVYDLRDVSASKAPIDVFRVLLQFAAQMKDSSFKAVELAFRGKTKFILKGDYFKRIGEEYEIQNPVYTVRTFPENLYRVDGTQAFESWTGGVLGVIAKQMDDFNKFNAMWYSNDLSTSG